MGYNANTKIISGAVGVHDVQKALSVTENDVGRLCVHRNVNQWAKFKPQKAAYVVPIEYAGARVATYFGLSTYKAFGTPFRLFFEGLTAWLNQNYKWGVRYEKPTGGAESPYRLDDFGCAEDTRLGYCKDAELQYAPCTGNYSIPLTYRPLLDGYTTTRPKNTETVGANDDPVILPGNNHQIEEDITQEEQAWKDFVPGLTLDRFSANKRYLSVSAFDILCKDTNEKDTYYTESSKMKYNRGFVLWDTSGNVMHWSVGSIPYSQWRTTIEGGLYQDNWNYAEFYTNVAKGNYENNRTITGTFILLPAAFGLLDIKASSVAVNITPIETIGTVVSMGGVSKIDLSLIVRNEQVLINNYESITIKAHCDSVGEQTGTIFLDATYSVNSFVNELSGRLWEKFVEVYYNYDGLPFHLKVTCTTTGHAEETVVDYNGYVIG